MLAAPEGGTLRDHVIDTWSEACAPSFADANAELMDELAEQVARRPTPRALLLQQMRAIAG